MNVRRIATGLMMVGVMAIWGCTSVDQKPDQVPVDERPVGGAETGASSTGAQLSGTQQGSMMSSQTTDSLTDPNSPLSKRIFYFTYDSSTLSDIDRDIIAAHGRYLASHPNARVVVQGNTDERGSREYNLALGERRADAVEQILTLQGAQSSQIQVVSFGEEHPVAFGHDEASWSQNRRAELAYPGQ
jgi:peptidoglycan-associated lipoprotein